MVEPSRHGQRAAGALPSTVVLLVVGREERARLAGALRSTHAAVAVERIAQLRRALAGPPLASALVVEPVDADRSSTASAVRDVLREFPRLPVIAYCEAGFEHSSHIVQLVRAGAHELLFRGADESRAALHAALAAARQSCAAADLAPRVLPLLPTAVHPFVDHCLVYGREPLSVDQIARALGVHRRTLVNYCARGGLPSPGALMQWCRLLLVGAMLETPGLSVEHIADTLAFPSATSLRNLLKRYTGLTPAEARAGGGSAAVFAALTRALESRASTRASPRVATATDA